MDPAPRRPGLRLRDELAMNGGSGGGETGKGETAAQASDPTITGTHSFPGPRQAAPPAGHPPPPGAGHRPAGRAGPAGPGRRAFSSAAATSSGRSRPAPAPTAPWPPSPSATPTSPTSPAATANSRSWSARSPSSTPTSTSWCSTTSTARSCGARRRDEAGEPAPPAAPQGDLLPPGRRRARLDIRMWREGELQGDGRFPVVVPYVEEWGRHHALRAGKRTAAQRVPRRLTFPARLPASSICMPNTYHAYAFLELGLTLGTGIYGSTFFMLTGFPRLPT